MRRSCIAILQLETQAASSACRNHADLRTFSGMTSIPSRKAVALALSLAVILAAACRGGDGTNTPGATSSRDTITDSAMLAAADAGRYEGSASAPIWIVIVSDFQCPYCKTWHDSTLAPVRRDYVATGKARLAYFNLPLQMHPHAQPMARAAMCASAQHHFWQYAISAMRDDGPALTAIARDLKLDSAAFARCQKSAAINALIQGDIAQAEKGHVQSTPSFFVGQFLVEGAVPYSSFKGAIDSALVIAAGKPH
jgi:protein-disulfide isomerase